MRILAFAYACAPGEGSEPGAGWAWARMLARMGDTWVITRSNNRDAIENGLVGLPERDRLHFAYTDLPAWARFWKRGRVGIHPYYLLWQVAALRQARRLHAEVGFDLVWHLTLANVWLGSAAPLVGPRCVYGPVGGGVRVPRRLLPALGVRGAVYEAIRACARGAGRHLNPLARVAWRSQLILVQNPETRDWLPRRYRSKAEVFPNVALDETRSPLPSSRSSHQPPTALFAGRLIPWKGGALAVRVMTHLPNWRLLVAGSGSDEARLRRLARRWGVDGQIVFLGHLPRGDLLTLMREETDVFLFPSLREEAGWVVAEAQISGLVVVCLGLGGPALLGARQVSATGAGRQVLRSLAAQVADPGMTPGGSDFGLEARARRLEVLVAESGLLPNTARSPGRRR